MAPAFESATATPPDLSAAGEPAIRVEHLCHRFNQQAVLNDVTFAVHAGEVVGLLGPNGAGKSTLLNILAGSQIANAGHCHVAGPIGYLSDPPACVPHQSIDAFLRDCARLFGLNKNVAEEVDRRLTELGLRDDRARVLANLSHGVRQRVGIAQALLAAPNVLLLDEPTNGLDPLQCDRFMETIKALPKHVAVIISSHQLDVVEQLCDRVLLLDRGECLASFELNRTPRLHLRFAQPFAGELLVRLDHAADVVRINENEFTVETPAPEQCMAEILAATRTDQWPLEGIQRLDFRPPALEEHVRQTLTARDA